MLPYLSDNTFFFFFHFSLFFVDTFRCQDSGKYAGLRIKDPRSSFSFSLVM